MAKKLFVRIDKGSGKPIVLLHGMFADGSQWESIADLLSKNYRVIVVDLFGHGRSPRPKNTKYTVTEHVNALHKTLLSLKADKDITMVGYSMGGAVALAYSSIYPNNVTQLYLISTPYYLQPEQMLPNRYAGSILLTKATTGLFHFVELASDPNKRSNKIIEFGNSSATFHKMIGANDNQLDADIIRLNLQHLVRKFDFVEHLKNVKAPITFYTGKKDIFVIQDQLNALRQYMPYMDIQRLDIIKVDHMLVQNLPRKMATLLQKNLNQTLAVGTNTGKGKVLVLLHGIESSSDYWKHLIKPLSENHHIIAIDLLGFGKSPKPLNIAYSLQEQVEWLNRTLEKLEIDKFEFCAHSLGSVVAMAYSAKYPNKVTKMTLLAPVFVPNSSKSNNQILKRLSYLDKISDGSFLSSHLIQALGYQRMSKYLPSLRTIKNTIKNQNTLNLANSTKNIPLTVIYGKQDGLIDSDFIKQIANRFSQHTVEMLDKSGHNFTLYRPEVVLKAIDGEKVYKNTIKKASFIPPTFAKQLAKLATPILILKSALYILVGLLLFTSYAPWVITLGLGAYVMILGYSTIRGAFSLRNENLSYIGYILLGILGILAGWLLPKNTDLALKISALIICGLVLLAGLARVIVALAWVRNKKLQASLLTSGSIMAITGCLALVGGVISTKLIIYSIAILLIARGIQFACFTIMSVFFAYIRGFTR